MASFDLCEANSGVAQVWVCLGANTAYLIYGVRRRYVVVRRSTERSVFDDISTRESDHDEVTSALV